MKSKYNFKSIEKDRYQNWLNKKYFKTDNNAGKKPFTIVIPPPNITGNLHLGHAWNNILQDILVRRHKMLGYDVLFVPGTDHAGIATQIKIKKKLKAEGWSEQKLTKEIFLEYAEIWRKEYISNIHQQWKALGLHLDYDYERFTLDQGFNEAVTKVFIQMYQKKLIYRDYKIVNWDSLAQTTISDTEVSYKEIEGKMFYLKYLLVDACHLNREAVEVATTRPETIFVDQALMAHPDDKRYKDLIGKKVFIPDSNIKIPIMTDSYVDMSFGTGLLKVTPAHDFNDFIIGKKHNLKAVLCINPDGTMNKLAQKYQGLDRFICREKLVSDLMQKNLVSKVASYTHSVGFASVSGSVIEPRLSLQWFLKTKEISKLILEKHKINFFPGRFLKSFNDWLSNVEDWCISRQLWWGHSIPVWYKENHEMKVQLKDPGDGFVKDSDVLDTWFSSALWPLCTLGWPDKDMSLFQRRFPINVLITGYDILTFWVSKMVLQSMYLTQQIPFKHVLLHGLVRDEKGDKMSKSKENGVDPLEIIDRYGVDALRWFLATNSSPGSDLYYSETKMLSSRNFINKLWNISRFVQLNVQIPPQTNFKTELLSLPEKFLLTQLSKLMYKTNLSYSKYEFNFIGDFLYSFVWEDLANWGLEFWKISFKNNLLDKSELFDNTRKFLLYVLQIVLQMLHPFIPFVTDAIYETLGFKQSIINEKLPRLSYCDQESFDTFAIIKEVIVKMRNFRQKNKITDRFLLPLCIVTSIHKINAFKLLLSTLTILLKASLIDFQDKFPDSNYKLLFFSKEIYVFLDSKVFREIQNVSLKENLSQQIKKLLKEIERSKKILSNVSFLQKANKLKIKEEKEKYYRYLDQYRKLTENDFFKDI
ncbi:MAG: valine--tRNA ligase [Weeping tea tree witches'-broom phytoplasma]|uniref:valine--tRNA ligase n=1 Tax=Candidatus Phytoplasma melaleucae TaxID=2982630 RepID=UPI00293B869A|nr:valine--tRNA ligase [Weeping tea tree witches'-broom phytoplasma]